MLAARLPCVTYTVAAPASLDAAPGVQLRAELVVDEPDALDMLRLRVLAKQASFEDLRAFIAARLRPLG